MSQLLLANKTMKVDELYMDIADRVSMQTSCLYYSFGALIVRDRQTLATGYNGAPAGIEHCIDRGECIMQSSGYEIGTRHETCRAVHAEQNAIIQCARFGMGANEATMYINGEPCKICARMIINVGIIRVVYRPGQYVDKQGLDLMREVGIDLCPIV